MTVHGLAVFEWDGGDEAGRRRCSRCDCGLPPTFRSRRAGFGVDPVTVWRWDRALAESGVAGLVPGKRGPRGASKLTHLLPVLPDPVGGTGC